MTAAMGGGSAAARSPARASAARAPEVSQDSTATADLPLLTAEEQNLFGAAVADARPLCCDRHLPQPERPRPNSIAAREAEALRELRALVSGELPFPWQSSEECLAASRPDLDPRVLQRLAAGEFAVQAELDLHGMDSATARALLERFLLQAARSGLRCVRIVHGRGRGSPSGEPVLKPQLPRWLARGPARRWVLAYASAVPRDGGAGASYVLLGAQPHPD